MDHRVNIDTLRVEYDTKGYSSGFTKEYEDIQREVDVFYPDLLTEPETLPVTIFSKELSPLQAITRYLKDKGISYSEIARKINRDPRTIWATYDAVKDVSISLEPTDVLVPLDVFKDRAFSTLESLVKHLLERGLSVNAVAELLGKNYQTIWTVKRRIQNKEVIS